MIKKKKKTLIEAYTSKAPGRKREEQLLESPAFVVRTRTLKPKTDE